MFLKTKTKKKFWLCAAAEVSLTELKKTGDSVVLFVASSTASQFNFTQAYDFGILTAKTEIHQFPAEGEINYFQRRFFPRQAKHVDI